MMRRSLLAEKIGSLSEDHEVRGILFRSSEDVTMLDVVSNVKVSFQENTHFTVLLNERASHSRFTLFDNRREGMKIVFSSVFISCGMTGKVAFFLTYVIVFDRIAEGELLAFLIDFYSFLCCSQNYCVLIHLRFHGMSILVQCNYLLAFFDDPCWETKRTTYRFP